MTIKKEYKSPKSESCKFQVEGFLCQSQFAAFDAVGDKANTFTEKKNTIWSESDSGNSDIWK